MNNQEESFRESSYQGKNMKTKSLIDELMRGSRGGSTLPNSKNSIIPTDKSLLEKSIDFSKNSDSG